MHLLLYMCVDTCHKNNKTPLIAKNSSTAVESNTELQCNILRDKMTPVVLLQKYFSDMSLKIVSFLTKTYVRSTEKRF